MADYLASDQLAVPFISGQKCPNLLFLPLGTFRRCVTDHRGEHKVKFRHSAPLDVAQYPARY